MDVPVKKNVNVASVSNRPTKPQALPVATPPIKEMGKTKKIILISGIVIGSIVLIALIIAGLVALNNANDNSGGCDFECGLFENCYEGACVDISTVNNCGAVGIRCKSDEYCNGDLRCRRVETNLPESCAPKTCSELGIECGSYSDECLVILNCGSCKSSENCSDGKCVVAV